MKQRFDNAICKGKQFRAVIRTIACIFVLAAMVLTACSKSPTKQIADENENKDSASLENDGLEESNIEIENGNESNEEQASNQEEKVDDEVSDEDASKDDSGKIEISLEEAVAMGETEANQYYDDLQVTEVHSYDNDAIPEMESGEDGKRQWWYVNFANEENNYVNILIKDGEIVATEPSDSNGNCGLFDMEDVNITAEEAVETAKELGLRGGNPESEEDWVSGYNYKLSYASLVETPEDKKIFFEVIGISPDGNFAHVDLDATNGELLLAEEKIEHSNGDIEWKPFVEEETAK